jgi:hypothetical protein
LLAAEDEFLLTGEDVVLLVGEDVVLLIGEGVVLLAETAWTVSRDRTGNVSWPTS